MAARIDSTPKKDGFHMPGEFEPQKQAWMIWPERQDNWRDGAKPAQRTYANVAKAISRFEPVTMCVSKEQFANCRAMLSPEIRVVEIASNDSWIRDCGPTFVVDGKGGVRAVDWDFNAWGGLVDGLYFPWDMDQMVAQKVCEIEGIDTYRTPGFVLEGGSIHADGEGTLLTTEMCLLSEGRNPDKSKEEIEEMLKEYLNLEKIIWIKDGIDPDETNGHVDDVACFVRPGEVACIWTDDKDNYFYEQCQAAYKTLSEATDAKGRKLKVHKLCMPKKNVTLQADFAIDTVEGTIPREEGDICIASYLLMFPAAVKLRKTDPGTERMYKVPGGMPMLIFCAALCELCVGAAIVFLFKDSGGGLGLWTLIIGTAVTTLFGFLLLKAGKKD